MLSMFSRYVESLLAGYEILLKNDAKIPELHKQKSLQVKLDRSFSNHAAARVVNNQADRRLDY
jgi:hypothetical protein